ncbi:MAG TPA: toll/interleukin-1 receptor domain-containing protein [Bryobacteraceae bacterium]|nr:toll/interleukin-1 receptor domain-containing protein [Bryobacteraceae bacterium]
MQTLSYSLFPCYAPGDRATAAAVAAFLERGTEVRVFLEEGQMRPGEDLVSKAQDARMADMVLVFFSRESMPPRWARALWEEALVKEPLAEGVRIGFARCDDCVPPAVLKPRFELAGLPLGSLRELKRWVRHHEARHREPAFVPPPGPRCDGQDADLEVLGIAIADRAGWETVASLGLALEFVRAFREDFDEVFLLEWGDRSVTALAGDLGAQLGLVLEGDLDDNLERLQRFCSARRFLLLLADVRTADHHEFIFGGRCSTLISTGGGLEPSGDALRRIQQTFASIDADTSWTELCDMARTGRRLAREQGRIAECYELMQLWHAAAEVGGDRRVLDESAREMVWILQGWGREEEARRLEYRRVTDFDDQMPLPF